MYKLMNAYIYRESTVVLNKATIKNATEDEFRPVNLILSEEEIDEVHFELMEERV